MFFRKDNSRIALLGQLGPKALVVSRIGLQQTPDFFHRTFAREELAGTIFEYFLAFAQSELHLLSPSNLRALIAPGQSKHEMSDDVALHFRRSSFDSVPAGAQITVCPDSLVGGQGIVGLKLAIGSQKLL